MLIIGIKRSLEECRMNYGFHFGFWKWNRFRAIFDPFSSSSIFIHISSDLRLLFFLPFNSRIRQHLAHPEYLIFQNRWNRSEEPQDFWGWKTRMGMNWMIRRGSTILVVRLLLLWYPSSGYSLLWVFQENRIRKRKTRKLLSRRRKRIISSLNRGRKEQDSDLDSILRLMRTILLRSWWGRCLGWRCWMEK